MCLVFYIKKDWKLIEPCRLQAMQKVQAAAGGKGRGTGGMPTAAQIQAIQVSVDDDN